MPTRKGKTMENCEKKPWQDLAPKLPLVRPNEAANLLSIGVSTYYELAKKGVVPAPIKITPNGRASGVPKNLLDAFVRSRMSDAKLIKQ